MEMAGRGVGKGRGCVSAGQQDVLAFLEDLVGYI